PPSLPAGVTQAQLQAAQDACADKRPAGGGFGGGGGGGAAGSTAFQAYASCLADHGVTVTTASTTAGQPARPGIDRNDPDFAKANETCSALLPQQGSPSTTTAS
ncbi:MAG: hypothetical protein JWN67_3742, partial [Actinomycetia bacterium]|nr:hypothetical protein [Actinomycetes bacterium]